VKQNSVIDIEITTPITIIVVVIVKLAAGDDDV
jgi:hypothetical protein